MSYKWLDVVEKPLQQTIGTQFMKEACLRNVQVNIK